MTHQRRKFLRLHPEKEKVERRVIPHGAEAKMGIELISGEVSKGRVIKRYRTPVYAPPPHHWHILATAEELKARFKFQKELYSKGFPVPRPIRFYRKGNDVVWEEEYIEGPTLADLTANAGKEAEKIHGRAMNELEGFWGYLIMRGTKRSFDMREANIVWDEKRKRFFVVDLGAFPHQKKMPKRPK
jgi:RIO-like serine/threonine protein kinase